MHKKAIVYPLKYPGGSTHDNFELRHSLRALDKHLQDDVPVYLISAKKPEFLNDKIIHIKEKGYMKAMIKACELAEEIIWWNDDIYLIKDLNWEYLRSWRRTSAQVGIKAQKQRLKSSNGWSRNLGKVIQKLREKALTTYSYVSHSPYLYETKKLKELFEEWDFGYKTSMETAYGNIYDPPLRKGGDKIMRYAKSYFWGDVPKNKVMLNHDNQGLTNSLKFWLQTKFPNPSKYEIGEAEREEVKPKKRAGG